MPKTEIKNGNGGNDIRFVEAEMKQSYLDYAMSVIVSRALPDVRDGLKPAHRRVLFTMHEMGLKSTAKFRKCAAIAGTVVAHYHPHGDVGVYDTLVRLAQDFNMRYPLVNGQGNFGSLDGDEPAAMRYTEAKMKRIASTLLSDINKNTVDFEPNYDSTRQEPKVLPARFPNLLINGTVGIAVGMATNIPPHNLGEVIDATVYLLAHPNADVEDLMKYVQGPDFPTGANIYDIKSIYEAYATGKGSIVMRSKASIEEGKRGAFRIIVTEIPYQVNKAGILEKIAVLVKSKKLKGIADIRDETDRSGIRIVIELKKDAYPRKILNQLFKFTQLQETFHVNMLALVDGLQPQVLTLKGILSEFIKHRHEVIVRRTKFELEKAQARLHILEGLRIAIDHINQVIATIKKSANRDAAKINLTKKFKLSELQADAILDMRLAQLAALERKQIEDEYKATIKLIKELKAILASEKKIKEVIKQELLEIKEKYADARRTKVYKKAVDELGTEDLVPNEPVIVNITKSNYIKRMPISTYKSQGRGGKGVIGMETKEEDRVEHILVTYTHNPILFFTNKGRVFETKVYEIPEATRQAKGQAIVNILNISPEEKVTAVISLAEELHAKYLLMATSQGIVKKTKASEYQNVRKSGLVAVGLKDKDELVWVRSTTGQEEVIIVTANGQSIRFKETNVRSMGRSASGVRGITLKKEDKVVGMDVIGAVNFATKKSATTAKALVTEKGIEESEAQALLAETREERKAKNSDLFITTENGYGKRTSLPLYKVQGRGGSGIKTAKVTDKTGKIVATRIIPRTAKGDLMIISKKGQTIRIPISSAPRLGRDTQGVRLMRLNAGDGVASVSYLPLVVIEEAKAPKKVEKKKPQKPKASKPRKTAKRTQKIAPRKKTPRGRGKR
ncbi:MAG: DNA gyrase subunit A [Candidatus Berkelbacteria bacterium]|nr:DNA gyrase subunit A [Candidatus Berkelbacteria bacterium]